MCFIINVATCTRNNQEARAMLFGSVSVHFSSDPTSYNTIVKWHRNVLLDLLLNGDGYQTKQ
jgi:hypothetical protein